MNTVLDLDGSARVFSALGDRTRLAIVEQLSTSGPRSVSQLAAKSLVTRQAVSQHLDVLANAGLVRGSRQGRERIWELNSSGLDDAGDSLDRISAGWARALTRLKIFVEE